MSRQDKLLQGEGPRRARPRLWHHDYLHLRALTVDLRRILSAVRPTGVPGGRHSCRVLDLGCGASPYRGFLPADVSCVRVDLDHRAQPDVLAEGQSLPFADQTFDGILATQLLMYAADPAAMVAEMHRVTRRGGQVTVTCHGALPDTCGRPENRFGEPDLRRLFAGFDQVSITPEGGVLGLPFALLNIGLREATRAAERRVGGVARILRLPLAGACVLSNLCGRLLERLALAGPLRLFLAHLDGSLPMNYLVVAERSS